MINEADTYCGKCIKADVCGMENVYDPATTYCAYRAEARPHGEWEWQTEDKYRCTNCGENTRVKEVMNEPQYNFCPNCGADMRKSGKMSRTEAIEKVKDMRDFIIKEHSPNDVFVSRMNEAIEVLSETPQCKFRSPTNCDFCSFHSDCDEHWKEGDEK